ncbi:hypothetical protein SAMN05192534_101606 [Alteribacillus persepolensis]|uniref:Sporulation lipoprotein YhcN/YlaJ (Spore_YhcN_YlaJ) n=1 Tax=Alteribacillus persepolensis TaxID=568899 RepID=A0A1G7ZME7_9BACI|nr:hypothetical protein [Alteribacillus persepolensis]SDH09819.1 hypothetical protein SAMN05192534_101606 [Alteribacillus persepolensis]
MRKNFRIIIGMNVVFLILLAAGCNQQASELPQHVINEETNEAEELLKDMDPITSAVVITNDDKMYAAAEVKHMNRFQLESIRKQGYNRLSKRWPDHNIHFSTDKKALMELQKLNNDMGEKKVGKKDQEKRLTKIEEFMKG